MTYVTAADGDWLAKDDPCNGFVAWRCREGAAVRPVARHIALYKATTTTASDPPTINVEKNNNLSNIIVYSYIIHNN